MDPIETLSLHVESGKKGKTQSGRRGTRETGALADDGSFPD